MAPRSLRALRGAAAVPLAALLLALPAPRAHGRIVDGVVAAVDNQAVTFSEVRQGVMESLSVDAAEADAILREEKDPERVRAWIAPHVDALLVRRELAKAGQAVDDGDVERVVRSVAKQNDLDDEAFRKALEAEGMTLEAYRTRLRWQLERTALLRVRKGKESTVTAEEAREWYRRNGDRYAAGGEVKLAILLFPFGEGSDRERLVSAHRAARAASELVAQGKGFAEAAKILSARFGDVRHLGGDFLAEAELPEEVRREVRRLDPGEVSPPFFTSDGGRVVSVLARRGGKVPDFDDVKEQVVEELSEKRGEKAFRDAMDELRREAAVEYRY